MFNLFYLSHECSLIFTSVLFSVVFVLQSLCLINVLQLNSYFNKRYFNNLIKNNNIVLFNLIFYILLYICVSILFLFNINHNLIFVIYLLFILINFVFYIKKYQKTPLKFTKRIKRYLFLYFLLINCFLILLFNLINFKLINIFSSLLIFELFSFVFVAFVNVFSCILERLIFKIYLKKAKKKIKNSNACVIGITGSFGKTTTKNILAQMLAEKGKTLATPKSYNTPVGVVLTINNMIENDIKFFVVEMGARQKNDIKYLCDLVQVQHGILTSIGDCHLETFRSSENIFETKKELQKSIKNGFMIFNNNNELSLKASSEFTDKKVLVGANNEGDFAYAKNIKMTRNGSVFLLCVDNENVLCTTKLIGEKVVEDIVLAATLAYKLGVTLEQIKTAIQKLEPIPHRLEILDTNNQMVIIDNSYNASKQSTTAALQTLSKFEGKKIVVTPGLVELGHIQYTENFEVGKLIALIADEVIIVNNTNKTPLINGLKSANFCDDKIHFAQSLLEAQSMLKNITTKDCVVLFENDLPDNYS